LARGENGGIPTFESEGYKKADWLPVFETFEDNSELHPHHWPTVEFGELLFASENETGQDHIYYMADGDAGHIWLEYSPHIRTEEGLLLEGEIEINSDVRGVPIAKKYE